MKKILLIVTISTCSLFFISMNAQVSFRLNIASQPIWGPVGYDHVEYYYLPEIDAYYYVPGHKYYYNENGRWVSHANLPARYHDFNLYNTRKVVINERRPYNHHQEYRTKYTTVNGSSHEQSIRDSHEGRYFENKSHPEHGKWKEYKKTQGR